MLREVLGLVAALAGVVLVVVGLADAPAWALTATAGTVLLAAGLASVLRQRDQFGEDQGPDQGEQGP